VRNIVFMTGMTLDGCFEGPNGEIDWGHVDAEVHQHMNEVLAAAGGYLNGRVTHEQMADHWPEADEQPDADPITVEYAQLWRDMPKYVYSRTAERVDWATAVLHDVVPEEVEALKAQPGGDLFLHGPDLAASFFRHDLVDEIRLYIHPVVLGQGHPAFLAPPRLELKLVESRAFGNGVVLVRYARA
jgi:dihydrofolate reductase